MSDISNLKMLTIEQRNAARERARQAVLGSLGNPPSREAYLGVSISQYPKAVNRLVLLGMVVVFVAAALPSFFRLYEAGRDHFLRGNGDVVQASIVGVATFLLAEFLVIVSTLTMRVYFSGRGQLVMVIPVALGVGMALVGNWHVAQPSDLFGWLETLTPPLAVLFMALIGERLILDAIHQRQANEKAYQEAAAAYQVAQVAPERHSNWQSVYATVLRDELIRVNRTAAAKALIPVMTTGDWKAAVRREMAAENWFESSIDVPMGAVADEVQPIASPFVEPTAARMLNLATAAGD
jgi:hypothetical protein